MKEKIAYILKRIQEGMLQDIWRGTRWIYSYAKHYWPAMIFYTLLGLSGTLVSLGSSFLSRDLVDIITGHQTGMLLRTFCMMVGLNIGNLFISQVSNFASSWISMKVDAGIKSDIFGKMLVTDWESISTYHTGDLMTRWSSDASNISNGILSFIPNLIINLFRLVSAFTVVILNDASFAVFALLGVPFSLLLSRTLMRRMVNNNNKRSAAMNAKMSGFNQETLSNIQTIKAFDLIPFYIDRLKQLQKEFISMRIDFQKMSIGTSVIMSLVGLLVSYSSHGWGIYRVWSGAISYGTMTLFLSMSGTLTGAMNSLISLVPTAISLTTSAGRLMDILEMPQEDYSQDEQAKAFLDTHRGEGVSLHLSNVGYTYQTGTQVFTSASLEAHPHEIIALVGPSGEGKTTMLRLILALLKPEAGEASLTAGTAGHQALPITPATRKLFAYVPQGNTMFSGTIAENLRTVKPDATDDEIVEALKQSCAWSFVSKLPGGIHSEIKERGGGLSEGQAQRLSIARALLRRSPILLLDEATSALDVATERQVLKNIMGDEYPRTCLVTTHRPTVLNICDRVYSIRDKQCTVLSQEEIQQMIQDF